MKGFVYFIINKENGKRYVGITTNFSSRISHHLCALDDNRHTNIKLQNAWNKYGKDNFTVEKISYDNIDRHFLREEEQRFIDKYDSYNNGYNCTLGGEEGEGNNSRGKMSYEDYCFAYIGNTNIAGMTNRTAKYLGCDSSTISSIKNEQSYLWYLERLKEETDEFKNEILRKFKEELEVEKNKPFVLQKTLNEEDTLKILCFVSTYGRGAEAECLKIFNLSKSFVRHFVIGNGRQKIKDRYASMTEEEICQIGERCYKDWNVTKPLKKEFTNLRTKYKGYTF